MYFDVKGKQAFATTGGKDFDNSKPTVIFLHGSGLDHTFWGLHSRFFAFRNYSVLVPDYPGHTHSDGPPLESIEAIADWLNDVVEALDARDISIVAHSQGCLVALEFASRYKERLKSVSFIASGLATPVNAALIEDEAEVGVDHLAHPQGTAGPCQPGAGDDPPAVLGHGGDPGGTAVPKRQGQPREELGKAQPEGQCEHSRRAPVAELHHHFSRHFGL